MGSPIAIRVAMFTDRETFSAAVGQYIRLSRQPLLRMSEDDLACLRGALLVMDANGRPDDVLAQLVEIAIERRGGLRD
jgi:hypothetical protein